MKNILLLLSLIGIQSFWSQNFDAHDMVPENSEVVRKYIEKLSLDSINAYRIKNGVNPLKYDTILKPAADHHIEYMRLSQTMSHYETIDVPKFEEIEWVEDRYWKLMDTDSIYEMTELLASNIVLFNEPGWTFEYYASYVTTKGFKISISHWNQLMNPKWDLIYIYYDLNYRPHDWGSWTICTVMLGQLEKSVK